MKENKPKVNTKATYNDYPEYLPGDATHLRRLHGRRGQERTGEAKCTCPDSANFGHEPGCPLLTQMGNARRLAEAAWQDVKERIISFDSFANALIPHFESALRVVGDAATMKTINCKCGASNYEEANERCWSCGAILSLQEGIENHFQIWYREFGMALGIGEHNCRELFNAARAQIRELLP